MQSSYIKRYAVVSAATALTVLLAGPAQAALQGRDIDGNAVPGADPGAVFLYDTDLDITWLRNANVNGKMNWDNANTWAGALVVGSYSAWRLPTSDTCGGYNCTGSEMGHLWYTELGNAAGPMTNTGDFKNLQSYGYWSGTGHPRAPNLAWHFDTSDGYQAVHDKSDGLYAMAVRPGDVAAIPEPQTYALMLLGLGAGALVMRRQSH